MRYLILLLLLTPFSVTADTLDVTIGSIHAESRPYYREIGQGYNPGVGYTYEYSKRRSFTAGAYTNTNNHTTVYGGYGYEYDAGVAGIGGFFLIATGYAHRTPGDLTVLPFPYLRIGSKKWSVNIRVSWVPTVVTGFQLLFRVPK